MITLKYKVTSDLGLTKIWGYGTQADEKSFGPAHPAGSENLADLTITVDGERLEVTDAAMVGSAMSLDPYSTDYCARGYDFSIGEHVITIESNYVLSVYAPLFAYAFADCPDLYEVNVDFYDFQAVSPSGHFDYLFDHAFYKSGLVSSVVRFWAKNCAQYNHVFDSMFRNCESLVRSTITVTTNAASGDVPAIYPTTTGALAHTYAACTSLDYVTWNFTRFPSAFTTADATFTGTMLKVFVKNMNDNIFTWQTTVNGTLVPAYLLAGNGNNYASSFYTYAVHHNMGGYFGKVSDLVCHFSGRVDPHVTNYTLENSDKFPIAGKAMKYNGIHQMLRPLSMEFVKASNTEMSGEFYEKFRDGEKYYAVHANVDASEIDTPWNGVASYESIWGTWGKDNLSTSFVDADVHLHSNCKLNIAATNNLDASYNKGLGKTTFEGSVIPAFCCVNQPREVTEPLLRRLLLNDTDASKLTCTGVAPFFGCDLSYFRPGWSPLDSSAPGITEYVLPVFPFTVASGAKWHDIRITIDNPIYSSPAVYSGISSGSAVPGDTYMNCQLKIYSDGGTLYTTWPVTNFGFATMISSNQTWPTNHTNQAVCYTDTPHAILSRSGDVRDRAIIKFTDVDVQVDLASFASSSDPTNYTIYRENSQYYRSCVKLTEDRWGNNGMHSEAKYDDPSIDCESVSASDDADSSAKQLAQRDNIVYDTHLGDVYSDSLSNIPTTHTTTSAMRGPAAQHGFMNNYQQNFSNFPINYGSTLYRHPYLGELGPSASRDVREFNPSGDPVVTETSVLNMPISTTAGVNPFVSGIPSTARLRLISGDDPEHLDTLSGKTIKVLDYTLDSASIFVLPTSYPKPLGGMSYKANIPAIVWPAESDYKLNLRYCRRPSSLRICSDRNPIFSGYLSHVQGIYVDGVRARMNHYLEYTLDKIATLRIWENDEGHPWSPSNCNTISVISAGTEKFYSRDFVRNNNIAVASGDKVRVYFEYTPGMTFAIPYRVFNSNDPATMNVIRGITIKCDAKVTSMASMFSGWYLGTSMVTDDTLVFPDLDTSEATNWSNAFDSFARGGANTNPRTFTLPRYDASTATNFYRIFYCTCRESRCAVSIPKWDTHSVTSIQEAFALMYYGNGSVVSFVLPYFNFSNVRTLASAFDNAWTNGAITSLRIPAYDFTSAAAASLAMPNHSPITQVYVPSGLTLPTRSWYSTEYVTWQSRNVNSVHINSSASPAIFSQSQLLVRFPSCNFIQDLTPSECSSIPDTPKIPVPNEYAVDVRTMFYLSSDGYWYDSIQGRVHKELTIETDSFANTTDISNLLAHTFESSNVTDCEFPKWNFSSVTNADAAFDGTFTSSSIATCVFKPFQLNSLTSKDRTFNGTFTSATDVHAIILPRLGSKIVEDDIVLDGTTAAFVSTPLVYFDTEYASVTASSNVCGGIFRCNVSDVGDFSTVYSRISTHPCHLEEYDMTCTEVGDGLYDITGTVTWTCLPNRKVGDPAMIYPGTSMLLEIDGKRLLWASKTLKDGRAYGSCFIDVGMHSFNKAIQHVFLHPTSTHCIPMIRKPLLGQIPAFMYNDDTLNYNWQWGGAQYAPVAYGKPNDTVRNNVAFPYDVNYDLSGVSCHSRGVGNRDAGYRLPPKYNGMRIMFSSMIDKSGYPHALNLSVDGVTTSLTLPCEVVWQENYRLNDCNYIYTGIVTEESIDNLLDDDIN